MERCRSRHPNPEASQGRVHQAAIAGNTAPQTVRRSLTQTAGFATRFPPVPARQLYVLKYIHTARAMSTTVAPQSEDDPIPDFLAMMQS